MEWSVLQHLQQTLELTENENWVNFEYSNIAYTCNGAVVGKTWHNSKHQVSEHRSNNDKKGGTQYCTPMQCMFHAHKEIEETARFEKQKYLRVDEGYESSQ